jgi:hypothetical protein
MLGLGRITVPEIDSGADPLGRSGFNCSSGRTKRLQWMSGRTKRLQWMSGRTKRLQCSSGRTKRLQWMSGRTKRQCDRALSGARGRIEHRSHTAGGGPNRLPNSSEFRHLTGMLSQEHCAESRNLGPLTPEDARAETRNPQGWPQFWANFSFFRRSNRGFHSSLGPYCTIWANPVNVWSDVWGRDRSGTMVSPPPPPPLTFAPPKLAAY